MFAWFLALSLSLGGVALTSDAAHALDPASLSDNDNPGGGIGNGFGDPDAPSSSPRRAALGGGAVGSMSPALVGDDGGLQSAWMWRLRIVLQVLQGGWIRP